MQQVVIHHGGGRHPFPHMMHLVMTFLTCGAWALIWIVHYVVWSLSHHD